MGLGEAYELEKTGRIEPEPQIGSDQSVAMSVHEFAKKLDGCEYGSELSEEMTAEASRREYLVIFGCSDDIVELRGVFEDELPAFDGTEFVVSKRGLIADWDTFVEGLPSEKEARAFFERKEMPNVKVTAAWGNDSPPWFISAAVPEENAAGFMVMDEGQEFCRGLVLDLAQD